MKKFKIIFWVSTGLLTAMTLMSAGMYFFNTAAIQEVFMALGYPTYIVIPLGIVKIAGLAAIWFGKGNPVREWAYAGFFFDFVLAFAAHIAVGDGEQIPALVATLLLAVSYFSSKKMD